MRKKIGVIILLLFISTTAFCQNILSGKIIDSLNVPVPYAIVALAHTSDSAIVTGVLTDENGIFNFNSVATGNYLLKISMTGFAETWSDSFHTDSLLSFVVPEIILKKSTLLEAVTISSMTPTVEFKNGNITVNIENSPLARGNSVYDLLFRLPGVSIVNNSITIAGRSGVIIMIDGRVQHLSNEMMLNLLKGMSAATVQKIEILKNPPVKFDSEGTSGMINIVTKRSQQRGFSGTVYTETSQGFYNNTSNGISLNYKNKYFSLFSSIDGTFNTYRITTGNPREIQTDSGSTLLKNENRYKILESGLTMKFGADWYINKSNVIGFKIDGGPGRFNERGNGVNAIKGYNNTGFDNYIFSENGHNKWNIINYNINAEHFFDSLGTTISFSADYTVLGGTDKSVYENHFYNANHQELPNPAVFQNTNTSASRVFSSKLDFIHPLDSTSSYEMGLKGSNAAITNQFLFERKNNSDQIFYTDTSLTTLYQYSEQNIAGYFNYTKSFKHFNLQIGIRGENTSVKGSAKNYRFSNKYFSLFPDLSLEYMKSEDHVFQMNFNRRFDRPDFDQLNPFIVYLDQYSYFRGNPFLQPAYSNTAEFTYSFKGIINQSISYSRINKYIAEITEQVDSTKLLFSESRNIDFSESYSYLLFIKYGVTNWYEISFNANCAILGFKGKIGSVEFNERQFVYDVNLSNTFLLPGKTKLELSALYRGPDIFDIVHIDPLWSASFAIQKSFFKESLQCSLGINDIFKTLRFHTYSHFENQNWDFYQNSDSRRLTFSLSYNFGKVKAEERESSSNEEEKERLGR
ncbi:outer membrane beta-barrel family protein [soil metagenome]